MEMQSKTPIRVKIIQIILRRKEPAFPSSLIIWPNGLRQNLAILKHCNPKGIPMIVTHHKHPTPNHERAKANPPNIIQVIAPNTLQQPIRNKHQSSLTQKKNENNFFSVQCI